MADKTFPAIVAELMAGGLSKEAATRKAAHEHPEAREAWVADYNAKHPSTDEARRRFASRG